MNKKDKEFLNYYKKISIDMTSILDKTDIPADNNSMIQPEYFLFPKIKIYFINSDKLLNIDVMNQLKPLNSKPSFQ
jgi:hypothetical protein